MSMFDGIPEFLAVAETQGFSSAARRLGVATSQISRRVSDLEAKLGVALVARTTRKVKLTEAGLTYYEYCHDIVNQLDQANEIATAGQGKLNGTLRVTAAGDFTETHIVPALLEFVAQHSELELEINHDTRMIDFVEENYDFAIRFGTLPDSNLIARKLSDHPYAAAASPAYLEKFGTPQTPQELTKHQCITTTYNRWTFQHNNEDINVSVKGKVKANSIKTLISACKSGLGILYLPQSTLAENFEAGQLVPILEPYWKCRGSTWIVYSDRKYLPARSRLAIEFLIAKFR